MYKIKPQAVGDILDRILRDEGLETPLLQKRVIDAWDDVAGEFAASRTRSKFIKNQTLMVKIDSPALRSELMMRRAKIAAELNARVGAFVIADIRIY